MALPPPWVLSGANIEAADGESIALLYSNALRFGPLIAAAPELLEACQLCEGVLAQLKRPNVPLEEYPALAAVSAAITKATGTN